MSTSPEDLLRATLAGDTRARERLAMALLPTIHDRVTRTALRHGSAQTRRNIRNEVEDLAQEICLMLFVHDCRLLRGWDPARGASLAGFVGLIAQRRTLSLLERRRHLPRREELAEDELAEVRSALDEEAQTIQRDLLQRVYDAVRSRQKPQNQKLMDLLFLQGRSIVQIEAETGRSAAAISKMQTRLIHQLRAAWKRIEGGSSDT